MMRVSAAGSVKRAERDDVWVIGGGPSAADFPFDDLRDEVTVVVNDGMLLLPWASAVVSVDPRWMAYREKEINVFAGERYMVADATMPVPEGCTRLEMIHEPGLSDNPSAIHVVGNSGYAALGVAYLMGSWVIHLIGFDFCDYQHHWYANTLPWRSGATDQVYANWAAAFDSTVSQLRYQGVSVINHSMHSRITAFPKCTYERPSKYVEMA